MPRSKIAISALALATVLGIGLADTAAVRAHDETTRLEAAPSHVAAGGVIDLRGVGFAPDQVVSFRLMEADGPGVELGTGVADPEGVVTATVVIPLGTVPGARVVRALAIDGDPIDLTLQVTVADLGGGEQRAEEEPLVVPMPSLLPASATDVPGAVPATMGTAATGSSGSATPPSESASVLPLPGIVAASLVILLTSCMALLLRRRQRRA